MEIVKNEIKAERKNEKPSVCEICNNNKPIQKFKGKYLCGDCLNDGYSDDYLKASREWFCSSRSSLGISTNVIYK